MNCCVGVFGRYLLCLNSPKPPINNGGPVSLCCHRTKAQCLAGEDGVVSRALITGHPHTTFSAEATKYQPEQIHRVIDHWLLYQSLIDECDDGGTVMVGGLKDSLAGGPMYLLIGRVQCKFA